MYRKKETSPVDWKYRWGLFSFRFLYNVLEPFLPMVKSPPRALVSLKTQHLVGVQINKLNTYRYLGHVP